MKLDKNKIKLFSGRSNPELARRISSYINVPLGEIIIREFSDGELWIKYEENIREKDVFIIQSTNSPSENIIELILMIDAAVRASAKRVTAVIPYFGYARQDRKDNPRVPISSRVMVDMITATGADRIISMDLHSTQIQGFTSIPFDHLYSRMVLLNEIKKRFKNPDKTVVLAPDVGSVPISQAYAKRLGMHFALIDKRRYSPNKAQIMHLIGNLSGKDVLIIDDMIDTAGTTVNAANEAMDNGALSVSAVATHAVFSGPAFKRIDKSNIKHILVTDTLMISKNKTPNIIDIVSVSNIFGEAIKRIHLGESVSALFEF